MAELTVEQVDEIILLNGKYKFYVADNGAVYCDRNGQPWRDFIGDKAVAALVDKVLHERRHTEALRAREASFRERIPEKLIEKVVKAIRFCGIQGGVKETVYGEMCHEVRYILRAELDAAPKD